MKKSYNIPTTEVIKLRGVSLLLNYSDTQAASGAESLSREVDFDFDGEY